MPTPKCPVFLCLGAFSYATIHGHADHHLPGNAAPMSLPLTMVDGTADVAANTSNSVTVMTDMQQFPADTISRLIVIEHPVENAWQAHHVFGSEG